MSSSLKVPVSAPSPAAHRHRPAATARAAGILLSGFASSTARVLRVGAWLWVAMGVWGCQAPDAGESATRTLRRFVSAMERSDWDSAARSEAFSLLAREARQELTRRADLATSVAARDFAPQDMLAESRFRLRAPWTPHAVMRQHTEGSRAWVVVLDRNRHVRARVPLVREDGRWRVALDLRTSEMRR